ncbi:Apolipoprotein N-acyltransferase, putative [Perkinsus marinus ATCC 50983]|uniref:Apolipoprotein N-acyltransferase, putative n=1 Tax=Perkinsus marinus (strain ATCC 50983 / TXsc) TaxID=423536 RepID=C5LDP1_PERM5|nr:Apolipoprotein N-acyltransferase, putative [Perkinsus marinus ATCC 50983]EER05055.1 Apolipoprotein N-acyltransferase, putative [Perkinsus marinus ATCC 50983]|eukprot:XP_002773239.1 Apolipoprotein N-acyltransferase, putative [Perkinsus marinus ATCC 50983]
MVSLTTLNSHAPTLFLLCLSSIVLFNVRTVHIGLSYLLELWPVSLFCLSPLLAAQRLSNSIWPPVVTLSLALGITFWNMALDFGLGLLMGLAWGMFWWLAGLFENLAFKGDSGYYSLRIAAMWVSLVYATTRCLGTMISLSTPFHVSPVLIQPVALFGFYSLEFAIICSNAALAQALTSHNRRHVLNLWQLGILGWALVSVLLYYTSMIPGQATVTMAAVSPGGYLPSPFCDDGYILHHGERVPCTASIDGQLARTRRAVEEYGAQLVVWPEGWLGPFKNMSTATDFVERKLGPFAEELQISMTVGASTEGWGNLALTIGPAGLIENVYGKQHPVRINGERSEFVFGYPTMPLNPLLVDQHVNALSADSYGRLGSLICYDMDFPSAARELVSRGATLILNPSQDWSAIRDHIATAVFRAVENRVAIAKADVGWDSAIIDPLGNRVVGFERAECTEEVIVGTVPLGTGTTLAVYLGDLVAVSCLMFVALALVQAAGQWVTSRRHVVFHIVDPSNKIRESPSTRKVEVPRR